MDDSTQSSYSHASGHKDGLLNEARFYSPRGICYSAYHACLYIADSDNHCIRRLDARGVSTVAGFTNLPGHGDGACSHAKLNFPFAVSSSADGSLYVAEIGNHTIRRISADMTQICTVAGVPGEPGFSSGAGCDTQFRAPMSLVVVDSVGFVFIVDHGNHAIRRLCMQTGAVDTIAGDGIRGCSVLNEIGERARFQCPRGIAWNPNSNGGIGSLYVADTANCCVRELSFCSGGYYEVNQVAGTGFCGDTDGPALRAEFKFPAALAYMDGVLYISNDVSEELRALTKLADGRQSSVHTVAGSGQLLAGPQCLGGWLKCGGLAVAPNGLIATDCEENCIRNFGRCPEYRVAFLADLDSLLRRNLQDPEDTAAFDFTSLSDHSDSTRDYDDESDDSSDVPTDGMCQHEKIQLLEDEVDFLKTGFVKMMAEIESLKDENMKLQSRMNSYPPYGM